MSSVSDHVGERRRHHLLLGILLGSGTVLTAIVCFNLYLPNIVLTVLGVSACFSYCCLLVSV